MFWFKKYPSAISLLLVELENKALAIGNFSLSNFISLPISHSRLLHLATLDHTTVKHSLVSISINELLQSQNLLY